MHRQLCQLRTDLDNRLEFFTLARPLEDDALGKGGGKVATLENMTGLPSAASGANTVLQSPKTIASAMGSLVQDLQLKMDNQHAVLKAEVLEEITRLRNAVEGELCRVCGLLADFESSKRRTTDSDGTDSRPSPCAQLNQQLDERLSEALGPKSPLRAETGNLEESFRKEFLSRLETVESRTAGLRCNDMALSALLARVDELASAHAELRVTAPGEIKELRDELRELEQTLIRDVFSKLEATASEAGFESSLPAVIRPHQEDHNVSKTPVKWESQLKSLAGIMTAEDGQHQQRIPDCASSPRAVVACRSSSMATVLPFAASPTGSANCGGRLECHRQVPAASGMRSVSEDEQRRVVGSVAQPGCQHGDLLEKAMGKFDAFCSEHGLTPTEKQQFQLQPKLQQQSQPAAHQTLQGQTVQWAHVTDAGTIHNRSNSSNRGCSGIIPNNVQGSSAVLDQVRMSCPASPLVQARTISRSSTMSRGKASQRLLNNRDNQSKRSLQQQQQQQQLQEQQQQMQKPYQASPTLVPRLTLTTGVHQSAGPATQLKEEEGNDRPRSSPPQRPQPCLVQGRVVHASPSPHVVRYQTGTAAGMALQPTVLRPSEALRATH